MEDIIEGDSQLDEQSNRYNMVGLSDHLGTDSTLPKPMLMFHNTKTLAADYGGQEAKVKEREYITDCLRAYLNDNYPGIYNKFVGAESIVEPLSLDKILLLASNFVWSTAGEHDVNWSTGLKTIETTISYPKNPENTVKCWVFNLVYAEVFDILCDKLNVELKDKHCLIEVSHYFSQAPYSPSYEDLKYSSGLFSRGRHGYLLIISAIGEDLIVSAVDPYHQRNMRGNLPIDTNTVENLALLDFTKTRNIDVILRMFTFFEWLEKIKTDPSWEDYPHPSASAVVSLLSGIEKVVSFQNFQKKSR